MKPSYPTWRIISDPGKQFRWSVTDRDPNHTHGKCDTTLTLQRNLSSSLPSMSDLLLQGYLRIYKGGGICDSAPMFRTGSGKAVTVKQASIQKALSVIGDWNDEMALMFRTGGGKSIAVKDSSVRNDLALIGDGNAGDAPMLQTGSRKTAAEESPFGKAEPKLEGGSDGGAPMFRTASGKSVVVKESSIRKALAVFGDGNNGVGLVPMFCSGAGKAVAVEEHLMMKASSAPGGEISDGDQMYQCATDHVCGFPNSIFQTGHGRRVGVSPAGLIRAKKLLGLEENYKLCTSQCLEDTAGQSVSNEMNGMGNLRYMEKGVCESHLIASMHHSGPFDTSSIPHSASHCQRDKNSSINVAFPNLLGSDTHKSYMKQPSIKFQTAGGRSITVSSDALQRARSLLGDVEPGVLPNEFTAHDPLFSYLKEDKTCEGASLNTENVPYASLLHQNAAASKCPTNGFPSYTGFNQGQSSSQTEAASSWGDNDMLKHVDSNGAVSKGICWSNNNITCMQQPLSGYNCATPMVVRSSLKKDLSSRTVQGRSPGGPLVDVSNKIEASCANEKYLTSKKRRLGRKCSISPFKRPRSSRFSNPLNASISFPSTGSSAQSSSEVSSCKTKVSSRYPFPVTRKTMKEFFGGPPNHFNLLGHLPDEIRHMSANTAEKYKFDLEPGSAGAGAEAFLNLLVQSGASLLHATEKWVANHYKWIVWKLACLERNYPAQASGKYLTMSNVLEELKYRYDREVNHGHRSAVKRILKGDASPASAMVLCISAIHSYLDPALEITECPLAPYEDCKRLSVSNGAEKTQVVKIELTDGWYSVDAILDAPLSKQLVSGKLFVGQKLRILGAGLCGWAGPVSPLECSKMMSLLLHINGTYRAHWADRLGFCRRLGAPLAFNCIKCDGGPVPRTLAGVKRIYPILYKERLVDGSTIVRSERMETKTLQLYYQRRSIIAEGIISELQMDIFGFQSKSDSDSEEGAKIFKLLETAAEPEVLMADMSSDQLTSFAKFKAKQDEIKQLDMLQKIEKALDDAGLSRRQVTPFMRVRIMGLTSKSSQRKSRPMEGVVTIWNPTEKQVVDLAEGKIYCIGGLLPLNLHSNIISLQTRGATTTWQSLPPSANESFQPFFTPRKAVFLSSLNEVPLTSEFDMAAVVVYVGEVYVTGQRKKQWIFVTDGSILGSELQMEEPSNCLLAVCFNSSITENDSISPFGYNLAGSIVGFCNLVKQARDQVNHLWVAEATENSTYFLRADFQSCTHLKEAANSACKWAANSSASIQKLRERVLCIIGVHSC